MKILIIEDDRIWQKKLSFMCEGLGQFVVVNSLKQAQEYLSKHWMDIVISDITLSDADALDFFSYTPQRTYPIVFVTGHDDERNLKKTMSLPKTLFLVKPFSGLSLRSSIERLVNDFELGLEITELEAPQMLIVKDRFNQPLTIPFNDILFLEADGNYSQVVTYKGRHILKLSMAKLMSKLTPDFLRVSKFTAVNLALPFNYNVYSGNIHFGEHVVPIGKRYRMDVMAQLSDKYKG